MESASQYRHFRYPTFRCVLVRVPTTLYTPNRERLIALLRGYRDPRGTSADRPLGAPQPPEPFADVTWPRREGRGDFERLLADSNCIVLVAYAGAELVGHLVGYTPVYPPTRRQVTYGVLRSMYVRAEVGTRAWARCSWRGSSNGPSTTVASRRMSTATPRMSRRSDFTNGTASSFAALLVSDRCDLPSSPDENSPGTASV